MLHTTSSSFEFRIFVPIRYVFSETPAISDKQHKKPPSKLEPPHQSSRLSIHRVNV